MMGLLDRARAFLTSKTPTEQLDEVRVKIREATAEHDRLGEEIGRRALPILRGDYEAAKVAADLERDKQAIAGEIATMRTAEGSSPPPSRPKRGTRFKPRQRDCRVRPPRPSRHCSPRTTTSCGSPRNLPL